MDLERAQKAVFGLLIERHPGMLTIDEVRRALSDVGDGNVDDALNLLGQDGLVNRLGDMVGASRAAVRADQLRI